MATYVHHDDAPGPTLSEDGELHAVYMREEEVLALVDVMDETEPPAPASDPLADVRDALRQAGDRIRAERAARRSIREDWTID